MNNSWRQLSKRYVTKLRRYLHEEHEALLHQAYDLGRHAVVDGLGVLDVARIHQSALRDFLLLSADRADHAHILAAGETFFLEVLSPFEVTHRGFREANRKLGRLIETLEDRNAKLAAANQELEMEFRARTQMEEMWRRYETIVNTSKDFMTVINSDYRYEAANDAYCRAHGLAREDIMGRTVAEVWGKKTFHRVIQSNLQSCFAGQDVHYQAWFDFSALGHHCFDVSCYPYVRNGAVTHAIVVTRDITERKLAEEALRQSEERFSKIFQASPVAICMSKPDDGRFLAVNERFLKLLGYAREEVIGRTSSELRMWARTEDRTTIAKRMREKGFLRDIEGKFRTKSGEIRDGLAFADIIALGGQPCLIVSILDITERKRMEQALREGEKHYRELFNEARIMQENLRTLSSQILHVQEEERKRISREMHDEIGQALTAVSVNLGVLKQETNVGRHHLKKKIAETQRLLEQTMETVHRFARELRPSILDELGLQPALRSYIQAFAERTGIRVRFRTALGVEQLNGERRTVLYRVAQESLTNVAKHARASQVEVTIRKRQDRVQMEIKDNGIAFKVKPQSAAVGKKRLGLLGMQERVRLVDGDFAVEAEPGKGTTIRVEIPLGTK